MALYDFLKMLGVEDSFTKLLSGLIGLFGISIGLIFIFGIREELVGIVFVGGSLLFLWGISNID